MTPLRIPGPALLGFDHVFPESDAIAVCGDGDDLMMGLDYLGVAIPRAVATSNATWDEVKAPLQVTLMPRGTGSTVFGDPLAGKPSNVARVEVRGGTFWTPQANPERRSWDDSKGSAPSVTVTFLNGARLNYPGLRAVNVLGGALRRGVGQSWFTRMFGGVP